MKILIYSPQFYPRIGGLEQVMGMLAEAFVAQGQSVKVICQTPGEADSSLPFEVYRSPSRLQWLRLVQWCDLYFQGNISLKGLWPLALVRRPLAVTHQSWYCRPNDYIGWQDWLKYGVSRFAINIAASQALADRLPTASAVIPNPYQEKQFYCIPKVNRDRELVFLGRLVSDKGADLLLEAMAQLKTQGLTPRLTIVGSGPEAEPLQQLVEQLGLQAQVSFVGSKIGQELAMLLNRHQMLVVPSRWQEPFGIVALEGIACGCVVVGSEGGGLKAAIGPCGVTFPNGDVAALTKILIDFLTNPVKLRAYQVEAPTHLQRHSPMEVAKAYLKVFEQTLL